MSRWTHGLEAAVAACLLGLAGCGSSEPQAEPDETPRPWDGSYTALEEQGDQVDAGPYAICAAVSKAENPCTLSVKSFNMFGCPRFSLGSLTGSRGFEGNSSFRFGADGQ